MRLDLRELQELIVHRAGLWLDDGAIFGRTGEGFQRIMNSDVENMENLWYAKRA